MHFRNIFLFCKKLPLKTPGRTIHISTGARIGHRPNSVRNGVRDADFHDAQGTGPHLIPAMSLPIVRRQQEQVKADPAIRNPVLGADIVRVDGASANGNHS